MAAMRPEVDADIGQFVFGADAARISKNEIHGLPRTWTPKIYRKISPPLGLMHCP